MEEMSSKAEQDSDRNPVTFHAARAVLLVLVVIAALFSSAQTASAYEGPYRLIIFTDKKVYLDDARTTLNEFYAKTDRDVIFTTYAVVLDADGNIVRSGVSFTGAYRDVANLTHPGNSTHHIEKRRTGYWYNNFSLGAFAQIGTSGIFKSTANPIDFSDLANRPNASDHIEILINVTATVSGTPLQANTTVLFSKAFCKSGHNKAGFAGGSERMNGIAVGDIDGDGSSEAVLLGGGKVTAVNVAASGGSVRWQKDVPEPISPVIINVNGKKIVVAPGSSGTFAWDEAGNPVWSNAVAAKYYFNSYSSPAVSDLNNDGSDDVIIANDFSVYAVSGIDGNTLFKVSTVTSPPGSFRARPAIYDINKDSKPEIITGDSQTATSISGTRQENYSDIITPGFAAQDKLSGIKTMSSAIDGAVQVSDGQAFDMLGLSFGAHDFYISAEDNAGNTNSLKVSFNVIATIDSLAALTERGSSGGAAIAGGGSGVWITGNGVANSLRAKINSARAKIGAGQKTAAKNILEAYVNEVEAQTGKAITSEGAGILRAEAKYVIEHL